MSTPAPSWHRNLEETMLRTTSKHPVAIARRATRTLPGITSSLHRMRDEAHDVRSSRLWSGACRAIVHQTHIGACRR